MHVMPHDCGVFLLHVLELSQPLYKLGPTQFILGPRRKYQGKVQGSHVVKTNTGHNQMTWFWNYDLNPHRCPLPKKAYQTPEELLQNEMCMLYSAYKVQTTQIQLTPT